MNVKLPLTLGFERGSLVEVWKVKIDLELHALILITAVSPMNLIVDMEGWSRSGPND